MRFIDMTGRVFGRLKVISCAGRDKRGQSIWECFCECGKTKVIIGYDLRSGHTKSCGKCNSNRYSLSDDGEFAIFNTAKGDSFIIDYDDLDRVKKYNWFIGGNGYMIGNINNKKVFLHKYILNASEGVVDHINRDKLDNRKCNLRQANKSLNSVNSQARVDNIITGHKNIKYNKRFNSYEVKIYKDKRSLYFGSYKTLYEAVQVANQKRKELFGEFAYFDAYICPLI